jgi:hypothetical protein
MFLSAVISSINVSIANLVYPDRDAAPRTNVDAARRAHPFDPMVGTA